MTITIATIIGLLNGTLDVKNARLKKHKLKKS